MRTFHVDETGNRLLVTDHPSVKKHLLVKGYKLADGPRGARQWVRRNGASIMVVNANYEEVPA